MRAMRSGSSLAFVLLMLAACDHPSAGTAAPKDASAPPDASVATTAASSAAPMASAPSATPDAGVAAKPELLAFQGKIGGEGEIRIALERTGTKLEGLYTRSGEDVALRGEMKDATRFTLTEVVPKGRKPASIDGTIDGMRLVGTLKEGKTAKPFTAGPLDPFGPKAAKFEQAYLGSLGSKIRIRMKLTKDGGKLSGIYRYARSKDDLKLEGTVSDTDGRLDLRETNAKGTPTGRFQGVMLAQGLAFGRWSSPDGSRSMPFTLRTGDAYPEAVTLPGGGRVVAQEDHKDKGLYCTATILYPEVTGTANKAAEKELDKALRTVAGDAKQMTCDEASDTLRYETDTFYTVTAKRPGRFAIHFTFYEYAGGAHGMTSIQCHAADLDKGTLTELRAKMLPDASREKLGKLVVEALRKEHGVTNLSEAGFSDDDIKVSPDTTLCVEDGNLVVQYQAYEIAPYAMGAPRAEIKPADAKPLVAGTELAKFFE